MELRRGGDISGGIASADVLGVFGAYGVFMASLWPSDANSFTYAAFQAFRDYDGTGKAFGDTSVSGTTDDVPDSSVYASIDSKDPSRLVVVAINKATADKVAGVQLFHSVTYSKASIYTLTAAGGAKLVPGTALDAVATNAFRYTMPAQSVTVMDFAQ